ncbi:hypothetical protein OXX59_000240 [Metschnikowia pulcherrima]
MESFRFITPACVKVSLVPVGEISRRDFEHYADIIQSITDIRLLDITPIHECRYFSPQEFPRGRLFFTHTTDLPDNEKAFLDDFEPFRKTFIVIGIGLHSQPAEAQLTALETLKAQFPTAITHNIIYQQSASIEDDHPGIFYISRESERIATTIESVLCGVMRNFIIALDAFATSYEDITLLSPVSPMDGSVLTRRINRAQKRLSSGSLKASFSNGQSISSLAKDSKLKFSQRQTGRRAKVIANLFLLAGRSQDALQYFTDAAINCKKAEDYLWLASALEGIMVSVTILSCLGLPHQIQNPMFSTVLHLPKFKNSNSSKIASKVSAESNSSRVSISVATPRNSTSSSLGFGAQQFNANVDVSQIQVIELLLLLASRSSHCYKVSTSEVEECVPDIVYIESLLRNVKLMTTIYLSKRNDVTDVMGSLVGVSMATNHAWTADFHLSLSNILAEIDQIFALQLNAFEIAEQCRIYCTLASVYGDLGLHRKRGLVLRLLLESLSSKSSSSGYFSFHNGQSPLVSIKVVIESLFCTYNIDRQPESSKSSAVKHYSDWIVLQLQLIKVCLRVAEALQDYKVLVKLCTLTLSRFTHCLPVDDQMKLKEKLLWLSRNSKNISNLEVPHPDPFMVRDAKFIVSSRASNLIPLHKIDDAVASQQTNAVIFDPFTKPEKGKNMDRIICQNEVYQMKVVLQNPFFYNLVIRSIKVVAENDFKLETIDPVNVVHAVPLQQTRDLSTFDWTTSVRAKKQAHDSQNSIVSERVTISPHSVNEVIVEFKALATGEFQVAGFEIALAHTSPQVFYIVDSEQLSDFEKLNYLPTHEIQGNHTLDSLFSNLSANKENDRIERKLVSLTAIPPQPSMILIGGPKADYWTMLLEGEIKKSSLTLKNCSDDVVDHLSISIWDSTIEALSSKLNQNTFTNSADIYELEWLMLQKKPLIVTNKSEIASKYKVIKPGGEVKIDFSMLGKRDMTESKLVLEYGKVSANEESEGFLKRLSIPFNFSIHRSLEIIANDIIPIIPTTWRDISNSDSDTICPAAQRSLNALLSFIEGIKRSTSETLSDYCLLVLDIKNLWKECLTAKLFSTLGSSVFGIDTRIAPDNLARVFLPVRKIKGTSQDLFKNIPSLRNKQFIKNYSLAEEEDKQIRKSFWVREALLSNLKGEWSGTGNVNGRTGRIDLRRISLSKSMASSLVYDEISIHHSIFSDSAKISEATVENGKVNLKRETFYTLRTRVISHRNHPIRGMLRHVPLPLNATSKQDLATDQRILYNGALQIQLGEHAASASRAYESELGFMILDRGQYEWGCILDVSKEQDELIVGCQPIYISVS